MESKTALSLQWPKSVTELHVHLGGAVPLYRLWETAIDRGIRGLGGGYDEFINILKIQDKKVKSLDAYLDVFDTIELIQSGPNAIRESVIIAIHRAYRTGGMARLGPGGEGGAPAPLFNIGRLELRFNPMKRTGAVFLKGKHAGLYDVDRVIKAAWEAAEDVEIGFRGEIQVGFILCFGRDMTPEANRTLATKIARWKEQSSKIIGIDLAGSEALNPLSADEKLREMQECYRIAGHGVGKTVHVGESRHVDLRTFIRTIEALEPHRVAHPITPLRAYWEHKDASGLQLLHDRGIAVELCVKSNLLTGAIETLEDYKRVLETFDDFGIPYTFGTDSPSLQGTSLAAELLLLLESGAATSEQVLRALRVADQRTFLNGQA